MIKLSENAVKELTAFFADKEKSCIRIYLAPGGCHGPRLQLALDEPEDGDKTETAEGFDFCMTADLLAKVGSVTIDVSYFGFVVEPEIPLPAPAPGSCGCSSCGSGCSGGCH